MGDEGKTVTTTADSSPWAPQQPYLKRGFAEAEGLLDRGPSEYYPGMTVADTSANTSAGWSAGMAHANAAKDLNGYTMGGGFLNSGNPYFQGMVNQIGQAIRPSIDSAFAGNGRLGSGAHANAYASALADKAGTLAFANYGDERGRMVDASRDYSASNAMMGIGSAMEAKDKEYMTDAKSRWDFSENAGYDALNKFMSVVGGSNFGGSKTSSQPYTGNGLMETFGTGISAASALTGLLKALK